MITNINTKCGLIWYEYNGDEIAWDGHQYLSICAESAFNTIEEIDKFLKDYFNK